jgi:hypothetical protein
MNRPQQANEYDQLTQGQQSHCHNNNLRSVEYQQAEKDNRFAA